MKRPKKALDEEQALAMVASENLRRMAETLLRPDCEPGESRPEVIRFALTLADFEKEEVFLALGHRTMPEWEEKHLPSVPPSTLRNYRSLGRWMLEVGEGVTLEKWISLDLTRIRVLATGHRTRKAHVPQEVEEILRDNPSSRDLAFRKGLRGRLLRQSKKRRTEAVDLPPPPAPPRDYEILVPEKAPGRSPSIPIIRNRRTNKPPDPPKTR